MLIVNAAEQKIEPQRDGVRIVVERSPDAATLPATLHGVIKLSDTVAYDVTAPVAQGEVVPGGSDSATSTTANRRDWAGVSGRYSAEPDAVRLSGAVFEGTCAGAEFE